MADNWHIVNFGALNVGEWHLVNFRVLVWEWHSVNSEAVVGRINHLLIWTKMHKTHFEFIFEHIYLFSCVYSGAFTLWLWFYRVRFAAFTYFVVCVCCPTGDSPFRCRVAVWPFIEIFSHFGWALKKCPIVVTLWDPRRCIFYWSASQADETSSCRELSLSLM